MNRLSSVLPVTVAARSTPRRVGTTHTYVLNGALLRDLLVNDRWVTVHVSSAQATRAA